MTRPITWSDEELRKALDGAPGGSGAVWLMRDLVRVLGAIHPHEAREREREAARYGGSLSGNGIPSEFGMLPTEPMLEVIDRRYPSLLPKSPPPLVLSTGTWTRRKEGFLWMQGDVGVASLSGEPIRRNATDNELYAKWLRAYGSTEEAK